MKHAQRSQEWGQNVGSWESCLFCITSTGQGEFRVYTPIDCSRPSMESTRLPTCRSLLADNS